MRSGPVMAALHANRTLSVEPHIARPYIVGALNWAVRRFDANGRLTLDNMARQAVDLFPWPDPPGWGSQPAIQ